MKMAASQALVMLARTTMRNFTKHDWQDYAGCESPNPMIGEIQDEIMGDATIVLDGDVLLVVNESNMSYGGQSFRLSGEFN